MDTRSFISLALLCICTIDGLLVINELNADNPSTDTAEFVELYDGGQGNTSLDDYQLVLFNGNADNDVSYLVVDLSNHTTNENGYFVVGTAGVSPPVDLRQSSNFLQNGPDAVALYNSTTRRWSKNDPPSKIGLVDAIVYGKNPSADARLVNALLPAGQTHLHEDSDHLGVDESLSRCQCCQTLTSSVFRLSPVTPGAENNCSNYTVTTTATPTASSSQFEACKFNVFINEINADSPGLDHLEFIELYDGGNGNVPLDGLVLVLYNGKTDKSYLTISLTGYQTDASGYFLLGSALLDTEIILPPNSVQNGADAIALYVDSPSTFQMETVATANNIVDAVVYGTNDSPDNSLIAALLPTTHQVNEDFSHHAGEESISRCFSQNQLHPESFRLTHPTPRQANNCTGYQTPAPPASFATKTCQIVGRQSLLSNFTDVLINEVVTDQDSSGDAEFVELYDGGKGNVPLNGYALYVVKSTSTEVTCEMLSGQTSSSGYFVLGTSLVKPTPSIIRDVWDIDFGAIALYSNQSKCQSYLSVQNLVDAVVFGNGHKIGIFLGVLTPFDSSIQYNPSSGCSIGRNTNKTPLNLLSFSLQSPTPGQSNGQPSSSCGAPLLPLIVINEVNADNPGSDSAEFVELYDGGVGNTNLSGLIVVFFNGNVDNDTSYLTIGLEGKQTNTKGYFVIGTTAVTPAVDVIQKFNFLQNGVDAVAIYSSPATRFPDGSVPTQKGLVDAIVYSSDTYVDSDLVNALLPNQTQAYENPSFIYDGDESLSRCQCCQTNSMSSFKIGAPTPGDMNDCSLTSPAIPTASTQIEACNFNVVINEINADSPNNDDSEFIELFDGGQGHVSLDGLVLVLFNGNSQDKSYFTISLTGYQTDTSGYFLLGSSLLDSDIVLPPHSVQNGPDGIALYVDSPSTFQTGTVATSDNIVDAVVYGTNDSPDYSLISKVLPTIHQVNENWTHHAGEESISRCFSQNQLHPESFQLTHPTPRQANNCTGYKTPAPPASFATKTCQIVDRQSLLSNFTDVLINEVVTDQESSGDAEFVELYDGGKGNVPLNGYALYIVNGSNSEVSCVMLSGQTSSSGYFVVGTSSVKPTPSIVQDLLDIDFGAIALYSNQIKCQSYLSVQNLVDAVVFGNGLRISTLLSVLTPFDYAIQYNPSSSCSIGRNANRIPLNLVSFFLQPPTPGQSNGQPSNSCGAPLIPTIVINEVNADNPGTDTAEFLELYDGGVGNTNLDGFVIVFFNGNADDDASYMTIDLKGLQTNDKGYFVIGTTAVTPSVDLVQRTGFLQNGVDAIAIYWSQAARFPDRSMPSQRGLVDAIVYSSRTYIDSVLVNALLPNQTQAYENPYFIYDGDESLSRCQCCQTNSISNFKIGQPTPGDMNDCSLTSPVIPTPSAQLEACKFNVLINEINADSPNNDDSEFIEIYDGGQGHVSLDGIILVLFNGNSQDKSYLTIPLTGYQTDNNGYFLLGSALLDSDIVLPPHSVQNGPDGIALYVDFPSTFQTGTVATSNNIVDAVVYGTNDSPDYSLISKVLPTIHQVNENWTHHAGEESISRCFSHNQLHPESFRLTHPTPRQANNCSGYKTPAPPTSFRTKVCQTVGRQSLLSTSTEVLINEVITDQESSGDAEFVELYDGGKGNVPLNGYAVYIVDGSSADITCVMLSGQTSSSGYFVVGTSSVNPTPSIIRDVLDIDFGAIALYSDQVKCQTFLSVQNLVDAVVFGKGQRISTLVSVLTPFDHAIQYSLSSGCSIGRNTDRTPLNLVSFSLQSPTPGQPNSQTSSSCGPPLIPTMVINEVNADNPETDDAEFLELYDGGVGNTTLDGFLVVFFNGNADNDASYLTIDLDGKQTSNKGYFVIGTEAVTPSVDLIQKSGFLQNGVDAVAIYWSQAARFPDKSVPTQKSLVDAIVYSSSTYKDYDLVNALLPKQTQAHENPFFIYNGDETLSRCQCCQTKNMSVYRIGQPTPGDTNDCSLTSPTLPTDFQACSYSILINEINADSPGYDDSEFIELYDGGNGNTPLDGLILVLFNGNFGDRSYLTVPLTGYQTDSTGYFLLGSAQLSPDIVLPPNSVQNGPDGVALYLDSPTSFPENTVATSNNIVDGVVYGTNDYTDYSLIVALLPTLYQVNEDWDHHAGEESISRCFSVHQLHPQSFYLAEPTPRLPNNCTGRPTPPPREEFVSSNCHIQDRQSLLLKSPEIVINEVGIEESGGVTYIELYDVGRGVSRLGGIAVYVFSADTMEVLRCWQLSSDDVTNSDGYFVVRELSNDFNMKAGAVAVYGNQQDTACRSYGSVENLADAVVFGSGRKVDKLQALLTPAQTILSDAQMGDYHISRCQCCSPLNVKSFRLGPGTPGEGNDCQSGSQPERASSDNEALTSGETAGVAVSVIVVAVALFILVGFILYKRRRPGKSQEPFVYKKEVENNYADC